MQIAMLILQVWLATTEQGRLELRRGHFAEAERLLLQALQQAQDAHADDKDIAIGFNDVAEVYRRSGRYSEAEPLYEKAILLMRAQSANRELITLLSNAATAYRESGHYLRSKSLYEEAMRIAKSTLATDDPLMGTVLNGLGANAFFNIEDLDSAQKYLQRALKIRETALGPDHLDVAETLNNLGAVYVRTRKYKKAEEVLQRALEITKKNLGDDHPDVAITLSNIGITYMAQKRSAEAEAPVREAYEIRKKRLPPNNHYIASSCLTLANVLMAENHFEEAQKILEEAIAIRSEWPHRIETEDALTLEGYARALRSNGNTVDADAVEARARSMRSELKYMMKP